MMIPIPSSIFVALKAEAVKQGDADWRVTWARMLRVMSVEEARAYFS